MRRIRLCALFAAISIFLLFLPASVHAESTLTASAAAVLLPSPDLGMTGTPLDRFADGTTDGWMSGTGISEVSLTEDKGYACLRGTVSPNADGSIFTLMRLFGDDRVNLLEHSHLSFGIRIEADTEALYSVSVTMYSALSSITAKTEIPGGDWYAISADISAWDLRTSVDFMEICVETAEDVQTNAILLSDICATGSASLDAVNAFLTFGFTADGGSAVYEEGAYVLDAGEDGILSLAANAARDEYVSGEGTAVLKVVLDGAKSGGSLSLAVSDAFSGLSAFQNAASCSLKEGTNTYLLPFRSEVALYAYRLRFESLFAETDAVRLLSVSLLYLPEADTASYAGKITSCAFSDGLSSLTVAGTLPSQTVADNLKGTIALYEIPVWSDPASVLADSEPVAEIKISNRFQFTVDLHGRESSAAVSRFAAVLRSGDTMTMIAPAVFPDAQEGTARPYRSAVGLSGANPAGIFSANAANVIVDVFVDELLGGVEGNSSGRLCIRGGRYYYLDTQYLRELDEELRFYSAADVDVYLRLLCGTDLSARGFTFSCDGAGFFAFDVTNEDGAYMLSAVTDYLAAAHPALRGFIVGERMDSALYNGADLSDLPSYAALCADTMQIVYTAAAAHIPDVSVIAPVGHYLSEADADADTVLLAVHLSRCIERRNNMPYGLMYVSDDAAELIGHTENLLAGMRAVDAAPPSELFFLWRANPTSAESLLADYSLRSEAISRLGIRAFFLGVDRQADPDTLYQNLRHVKVAGDTGRTLHEFTAQLLPAVPDADAYTGKYTLYDFTKSFSTLDWIAGSGCATLTTQSGVFSAGTRSLHAVFPSDSADPFGKASGSILCMMPSALDFTNAPYFCCTLLVASALESTDTAEIVFVFGSEDARAEYAFTAQAGQPVRVLCDLSAYGGWDSITSAAILVRADSPVTVDIPQILCYSDTHTAEELDAHFSTAADTADSAGRNAPTAAQFLLWIFIFVATLSAFALLSRRENDRRKNGGS